MRKYAIILWAILMLLLVACGKKEEKPVESQPEEPDEEIIEEETFIYPLTGMETTELPENRAFAVMVNNQKEARPQNGLSDADIVFEILAEGNITRFMAIYQSTVPERVGPVRSAREYYFTLAQGYDALYIYHGAAKFVDAMIRDRNIENLNGAHHDNDKQLFVRESFRVAPHNSYLLTDAIKEKAEKKDYDMSQIPKPLSFLSEDEELDGEVANYVKIEYYGNIPYVEYEYDHEKEKYIRFNDGTQTVELETEDPILIDNIFIVEAEHQVIDNEGRRAVDIESGGKAYLLQRGKVQKIEWENIDGRITPIKDGEIVPFVPGKTWINFVQKNPPSSVSEQVMILENKE